MWEIVKAEFPEKQQKAIKQLKEKCLKFYDTYFVPTVQPKLEKVSFCKIKEVFTAGASASSFVESMNSSMGRWFLSSSNSFVEVINNYLLPSKRCSKHQRGAANAWDCELEHKWTYSRHRFSEGMSVNF